MSKTYPTYDELTAMLASIDRRLTASRSQRETLDGEITDLEEDRMAVQSVQHALLAYNVRDIAAVET